MSVQEQIDEYIASQQGQKRNDLLELHRLILGVSPECTLWFLDGRDEDGRVVANPNIGYGTRTMTYAGGKTREFYRIGLSANKTGISVYVLGLDDRTYLAKTYGESIGKARVTGYCVRFKTLTDIDIDVLASMVRDGFEARNALG